MSNHSIVGTWRLVKFEYRAEDGTRFFPYGEQADGVIVYDDEGFMSTIITRTDRPPVSAHDFVNIPDEEKIELSKGFVAYSGKYEMLSDRIVHHVEISYVPNWVGTTLERFYEFTDGNVILSTPPVQLRGKEFSGYITWGKHK